MTAGAEVCSSCPVQITRPSTGIEERLGPSALEVARTAAFFDRLALNLAPRAHACWAFRRACMYAMSSIAMPALNRWVGHAYCFASLQ